MTSGSPSPFTELLELIDAHTSFVVATHADPDGDAIGSAVAMAEILRALGKSDVVMHHSQGAPAAFLYLTDDEWLSSVPGDIASRVAIIVDCAARGRVAATEEVFGAAAVASIDHHSTNGMFGEVNIVVPEAAATCELLARLAEELQLPVSQKMAYALYTGIYTDTGNLTYVNVTDDTRAVAADLEATITDLNALRDQIEAAPESWQRFAELGIDRRTEADGFVFSYLSSADRAALAISDDDTKSAGAIAIARLTETDGVVFAQAYERDNGQVSISLRCPTGNIHVGTLAADFGGGGHVWAAGYTSILPIEQIRQQIYQAFTAARAEI